MDKPETSLDNNAVLVPFGPTRAVPENHRWCFACDGSGKSCNEEQPCCEACKGKGHWNAEDIRDYHAKHPDVCQQVCGLTHREPSFGPPTFYERYAR